MNNQITNERQIEWNNNENEYSRPLRSGHLYAIDTYITDSLLGPRETRIL